MSIPKPGSPMRSPTSQEPRRAASTNSCRGTGRIVTAAISRNNSKPPIHASSLAYPAPVQPSTPCGLPRMLNLELTKSRHSNAANDPRKSPCRMTRATCPARLLQAWLDPRNGRRQPGWSPVTPTVRLWKGSASHLPASIAASMFHQHSHMNVQMGWKRCL